MGERQEMEQTIKNVGTNERKNRLSNELQMLEIELRGITEDTDQAMQSIFSAAFPLSTEADWESWMREEPEPRRPIVSGLSECSASPFASVLIANDDDWAVSDCSYLIPSTPWDRLAGTAPSGLPEICRSTNLKELKDHVLMPVTGPLAAKCTKYLPIWRSTCGGADFMRIGMCTYWKDPVESPRRLRERRCGHQRRFQPNEEMEYLKLQEEEIREEIVIEVPPDYPIYTSPVHIVPKKNGWRKVWDGRVVNNEQMDIHFRMEGPITVQRLMRPGDWATSIDLKSAFNHLLVSESMRPYLCFRYAGRYYSYRAMPFGAKHSPRLFTEALGYAVKYIRANWEVRMVAYMDDLLFLHQDPTKLEIYTFQIAAYL